MELCQRHADAISASPKWETNDGGMALPIELFRELGACPDCDHSDDNRGERP